MPTRRRTDRKSLQKRNAPSPAPQTALQRAAAVGVDLTLLRERLRLTPTERLEVHRQALASIQSFTEEVQRARHRRNSQGSLGKRS